MPVDQGSDPVDEAEVAPARLGAGGLLVGELGECLPVPQPHRVVEQFRGIGGTPRQGERARLHEPTEPCRVHISRVQLEQVRAI